MNESAQRCLLLASFVALVPFISAAVVQSYNTTGCQCEQIDEYHKKCSCLGTDNKVQIEVHNLDVTIKCEGFDKIDTGRLLSYFDDIPTPKTVSFFIFTQCPLPDKPFADIINGLNITKLDRLRFESDPKISDTLRVHHFENFTYLDILHLQNNSNLKLPENAFQHLPKLTTLGLNNNSIHTLPGKIFDNLTRLESLYLENNKLADLPDDVFQFNGGLRDLLVQNNTLSSLPDKLFSALTSLSLVDLSYNRLTTLPANLLENCEQLQMFSCKGNFLQTLQANLFQKQTILWRLDISDNRLEYLDESLFGSLKSLTHLYLSGNRLKSLSRNTFAKLRSLQYLYLDKNQLTSFDEYTFGNLHNLISIDLANNQLMMDQSAKNFTPFAFCSQLANLDLRNNSLTKLFFNMKNLSTHLTKLDLSFNKITSFALEELSLKVIPQQQITIDLSNNQITTLRVESLENIVKTWCSTDWGCYHNVITFKLSNNPIKCDCNISSLGNHIRSKELSERNNPKQANITFDDITCQ